MGLGFNHLTSSRFPLLLGNFILIFIIFLLPCFSVRKIEVEASPPPSVAAFAPTEFADVVELLLQYLVLI